MAQMDDFDDLDDLGSLDDFEDLDGLTLEDEPPEPVHPSMQAAAEASPPAAAPTSALGAVIKDLMNKRNYAQVLQIAETQKDALEQDSAALEMVRTAQSNLQSESFVQSFLEAAATARDAGDAQGMQEQLAKARTLDAEHPAVAAFSTALPAAPAVVSSAPIAAPPPAQPVAETPPSAPPTEDDFLSFDDEAPLDLSTEVEPAAAPLSDPVPAMPSAPEPGTPLQEDPLDLEMDDLSLEEPVPVAAPAQDDLDLSFAEPDLTEPAAAAPVAQEPVPVPAAPVSSVPVPQPESAESDGGDRIQQLLAEGKETFAQGDYQAAIDIWSRIFLIDIDNSEASRLIEEARSKKAELERQAEEFFHQGGEQIEQRQLEEAKASFRKVLEIDPGHSLAQEYLEQLEDGKVPNISRGGDAEILTPPDADGAEPGGGGEQKSMEAAVQRDRIVVTKKLDRRLLALGALVAILVVGGGAFLAMQWDTLFPNQQEVATAPVRRTDPIEKATELHEEGKTEDAIRLLERIVESDPVYQDAGALIAQWKAEAEAPPEDVPTGPSEQQLARRDLLVQAARQASGERRYIRARKYFDAAEKIQPLSGEVAQLHATCTAALVPLSKEIELFDKAEYERLIPDLWRRREREPESLDVGLLLVDSYYNLALTDLQRGNALGAADKLKDALQVQPDNRELQRLELFARSYATKSQDLLYRIYVKYLPSRS